MHTEVGFTPGANPAKSRTLSATSESGVQSNSSGCSLRSGLERTPGLSEAEGPSVSSPGNSNQRELQIDRCRRELAAVTAELRAGNPDVHGLCLAVVVPVQPEP